MGRAARHLTRRDVPLVVRFRRGVWVGFAVAAAVAGAVLALTANAGGAIESNSRIHSLIEQQRLDLSRIEVDMQRLASTEDPDLESKYRLAIGEAIDVVRNRQALIVIADPEAATLQVGGDTGERLDAAVADVIDEVGSTVVVIEAEEGGPIAAAAVARALEMFSPLDAALADISHRAESAAADWTDHLVLWGRGLALSVVIAATVRLFLVGMPLVTRLDREQAEVRRQQEDRRSEAVERELASRLADGMEGANSETAALRVLERALTRVVPGRPAEMLLADSSMAHMSIVARNESIDPPGCGVASPWSCPAVRRSETTIFEDSESIRACPFLADRPGGRCSAVCVPVLFMGGAMGVLHVTGEVGWRPSKETAGSLRILARQTAMRIGTIRSFARAEIQASTDVLTGLPNRRATDERLGEFLATRERGSVVMADLDHFKSLNDNYGHEIGDRALRLFASTARLAMRDSDWIGRWGGEEFVFVMPGLSSTEAAKVLERLRGHLAAACAQSDAPTFTVSIGVVDTTAGNTADDLVKMADDCLYAAKEEGRDRVVVGPVAPRDPDEGPAGEDGRPRVAQGNAVDPEVRA